MNVDNKIYVISLLFITILLCVASTAYPAGDSGPNRPPIPIQIGHPFRSKSAACSDPNRPGIPDQIGHPFEG